MTKDSVIKTEINRVDKYKKSEEKENKCSKDDIDWSSM